MMCMLWVVLFLALAGPQLGHGLPVRSTPQAYPHDASEPSVFEGWGPEGGAYAAVPALALVLTVVGLLLGCTWCYRHKDCKPEEGADNQLFSASATQLHDARRPQPADSGFSEPVNNNVSEDNNNGPISMREMQNIANNNAGAYIVSENEERNRASRESVVEFEPLPAAIRVVDPLERHAHWFGTEDVPRNRLQYLREFARGWFGRVVETEMEEGGVHTTVAVKILNQNATLEDKARFLSEARVFRDVSHENVLAFVGKCLQEDPWILIFEMCTLDLRQYLIVNRPKMAILNEGGVPLRLMCDVAAGLAYLHSRGYYSIAGSLCSDNVLVRDSVENARAVVGSYAAAALQHDFTAPETRRHPPVYSISSEVWSLGTVIWEVCTWGASVPQQHPLLPDLPCPYRNHLYQVMQLCWTPDPLGRPTAAQVHALVQHLHHTHLHEAGAARGEGPAAGDFEDRWQRLKPNTIPKVDEHVAIVHAPSTSMASHFTASDQELDNIQSIQDTLSVDMDTAVSRSSSIMSDKDPLSVQIKSESLNNLHGSLEDVRNIYLTHNEMAVLDCHQGNIALEDSRDRDNSDSSMDPWLKDIIAGSQDDVSYYRDVSDVIKNLDNILNSEKTSSSESSHQASPSRDNLSLDCKKEYPVQSSMVKSPGISNFQNALAMGFDASDEHEPCEDEEVDRDTIGTLSHSFERHSDTASQHTLENLTPDTPIKDIDFISKSPVEAAEKDLEHDNNESLQAEMPKENEVDCSDRIPNLRKLCVASMSSVSETNEQLNIREDCETSCDNNLTETVRTDTEEMKTKSIDNTTNQFEDKYDPSFAPVININVTDSINSGVTSMLDDLEPEIEGAKDIIENIDWSKLETETPDKDERDVASSPVHQNIADSSQENILITLSPESNLQEEILEQIILEIANNEPHAIIKPSDLILPVDEMIGSTTNPVCEVSDTGNDDVEENDPFLVISSINQSISHQDSPKKKTEANTDMLKESKWLAEEPYEAHDEVVEETESLPMLVAGTPELVQNILHKEEANEFPENTDVEPIRCCTVKDHEKVTRAIILPTEEVQNIVKEDSSLTETQVYEDDYDGSAKEGVNDTLRSDTGKVENEKEQSNNSTVYMDLINDTNSELVKADPIDDNVKDVIKSCLEKSTNDNTCTLIENESTVYLDLPSVLKERDDFLHSERINSSRNINPTDKISSSTPKGNDSSTDKNPENSERHKEFELMEMKATDDEPGVSLTKLELKYVPDSLSPFESPTKSHPTDTYDENSSVVLGPFENCTTELTKGCKPADLIDLPKEELLAFSSNFSEINLETPSPLRDGNFLNEVPDIVQFDDITTSEENLEINDPQTENTDETDQSSTAKHVSPSTPPNSPGFFLASTSQQKYLVDIDLDPPETVQSYPPIDCDSGLSSLQKEIDLNQIELTTKLAMAENENNMNIEYSGPLTVEGLVSVDDVILMESDAIPESFLAGNGGSLEDLREEGLAMDEESMKALRNELELKLPLAQVAAIEPACEGEWSELPPPPELIVSYSGAGALSPIAEETNHQLSAYENDAWNTSTRTDSSESYPEPCNNSTDEVTDLPTAAPSGSNDHSTYTIQSRHLNDTFTIQKDIPSSKEMTMSADSLNGSPYKEPNDAQSPIDDKTYNKNDEEKESNCERISQVSPFLTSPTTDTSAPVDSENVDNATGVSTLSKTSLPTDAKLSKPSECLSKATSIDSWCSNDTLYNVEENFDDLAMDPETPLEIEPDNEEKEDKSDSTDTLTHNDDEKELSHCSTYIIHDSKSDASETFSPDSITANDNFTFTKVKTEAAGTTEVKSEVNDSAINTQTKDLAYGTLPSYSNCTTEFLSGTEDPWKLSQPELIRRSPIPVDLVTTPPRIVENNETVHIDSPLTAKPCITKLDSVDICCLADDMTDNQGKSESSEELLIEIDESPKTNYNRSMAPSVTSTPLTGHVVDNDSGDPIVPEETKSPESDINSVSNFQMFLQSAELRPQDVSPLAYSAYASTTQDTGLMLEGDTLSKNSNRDSQLVLERTPTYSDFESSAANKPQDVHSQDKSSRSEESGMSSGDFRHFESSVRNCPQDLSSMINASSLLLTSERKSSEMINYNSRNTYFDQTSQSGSRVNDNEGQHIDINPPNITNLNESHQLGNNINHNCNVLVSILDSEEETEQPHSIIITEIPKDISMDPKKSSDYHTSLSKVATEIPNEVSKESPNRTYDSHGETAMNHTYDSHSNTSELNNKEDELENIKKPAINGISGEHTEEPEIKSPKVEAAEVIENHEANTTQYHGKEMPNGSIEDILAKDSIDVRKCNGNSENYATVQFLNETFEELMESNVDENDTRDIKNATNESLPNEENGKIKPNSHEIVEGSEESHSIVTPEDIVPQNDAPNDESKMNGSVEDGKVASVTDDFLQNEKQFCQFDSYLPLLGVSFTGPASDMMSTSFTQDSPTEPNSPECEQDSKPNTAAEILKDWDSDSESHSSNSSSGEFIWKDGDGREIAVVPNTHFDHRGSGSGGSGADSGSRPADGGASEGSGDSGSGSEGDEVEFVPSSWDCRAAPSKSSLRSLEQAPPDSKKRVVFKRQKYHCVYEYPREAADVDTHSPAAYLPDFSTYCEWDPTSAEEAELGYGQLFGGTPLDMYPLRAGIAFGADFDEDFFISSSARPFESLGLMSTTSQFFPGMHVKPSALLERDLSDDVTDEFPPPPSPLLPPPTSLAQTRTPSLDFTTPDSGVEDITPGSTSTDEEFKVKKLPESEVSQCWRPVDSGSSSESVSPSSPGGEALGGLRHTRDKLKLDLPLSPHIIPPSPRHNRVFNFVLDKPKRHRVPDEKPAETGTTPLVMTDDTPVITTTLPVQKETEEITVPEPTFSTFGKCIAKNADSEQKIILTDEVEEETTNEVKEESPVKTAEPVKGEGTVLDSGDEDSGIESSSKATLERNKTPNVS